MTKNRRQANTVPASLRRRLYRCFIHKIGPASAARLWCRPLEEVQLAFRWWRAEAKANG